MIYANPPNIVVSQRDLSGLDDWQAALDRQNFRARLRLESLDFTPASRSVGYLDEHRLTFLCERLSVAEALGPRKISSDTEWRHAYTFRGGGLGEAAAAAAMMTIAFVKATDGAVASEEGRLVRDVAAFKRGLDDFIGVVLAHPSSPRPGTASNGGIAR